MRITNFVRPSFVDNQDEVTTMYSVNVPKILTRLVIDESGAVERLTWKIINGSQFGPPRKSVIRTESVVQIVIAIHIIPTNFGAHVYLGSNPSRPVIGT